MRRVSGSTLGRRIAAAADDSRAMAVFTHSVVARALTRATVLGWRSLSAERSWIGRAVARRPITDFDALVQVSSESALYGLVASSGSAFGSSAWRASSVRQFLETTFEPISAAGRMRLAAWAGIVMVAVRVALTPSVLSGPTLTRVWLPLIAACVALFAGAPVVERWLPPPSSRPDPVRDSRFS